MNRISYDSVISNYPSNSFSYSKMNHKRRQRLFRQYQVNFAIFQRYPLVRFTWRCFFSWRQSLIGVLPGRWQVDDTRAEKNRRGGGKDGIRNGLCGCRWTTVLIAPPNASKRPQMLSSRGIETFVQTALFYPPLLRDLPSLSLLLIRDRQLKKGPG